MVGLYLSPPDKTLVLCLDEKSQIQALDRTQPGLPLKKGRCGTMTHDYKRNGTTTLFAALNESMRPAMPFPYRFGGKAHHLSRAKIESEEAAVLLARLMYQA